MSKKVISIVLCLALVLAMAIPAFAASATLYTRTNAGYRIIGTATVSGSKASSTMTAAALSDTPSHPISDYSRLVWINVYDSNDEYVGYTDARGVPTLVASYSYSKGKIARILTGQIFNQTRYGNFDVYA